MTTLSVAVLNCGYTVPSVEQARGQYHDLFAAILQPAVDRHNAGVAAAAAAAASDQEQVRQPVRLEVRGYDTVKQVYPPSLEGIDALIITGSPNGAYEELPWIEKLIQVVAYINHAHPSIKLYGSCFGHQVICAALYRDCGAVVRKDPAGYELGVHSVDLDEAFARHFGAWLGPTSAKTAKERNSLRLQFLHGDHVLLPADGGLLPDGVGVVGSTPHCDVQGIYEAGRILTFQGHPEFDPFINTECLKLVGARVGWDAGYTEAAIASAQADDDAATAADIIVAFFLGMEAA